MSVAAAAGSAWLAWAVWVSTSTLALRTPEVSLRRSDGPVDAPVEANGAEQRKRARRTLAVGLAALVVHPLLALAVAGWWARGVLARRREAGALDVARRAAVPEVADLFVVALSSGLTVRNALLGVAEVVPGPLVNDVRAAGRRLSQGDSVTRVLGSWSGADHPLAPVGAALAAADRSGTAATPLLSRCADQQRELARRSAEAQVRRLPVRLLGPLVLCILPALMVATFGPLAVVSLQQLGAAVP